MSGCDNVDSKIAGQLRKLSSLQLDSRDYVFRTTEQTILN